MAIEPDEATVAAWTSVLDIATWAGFNPSNITHTVARDSFFELLGLESDTHYRVLGGISETDLNEYIRGWTVSGASPTPASRASAGILGRAARIACGTQRRIEDIQRNAELALQAQALAPENGPSQNRSQKPVVKLAHCIDQASDLEADTLTQDMIDAAYKRYDEREGGYPSPDLDPSVDQLSGLYHIVRTLNLAPYVDFAVFGPHSVRVARKMRLSGLVLNASGEFFRTELSGPVSYAQWESCFNVFKTCMIMLGFASPSALESYKNLIRRYAATSSDSCWALLYQSDVRARRELANTIRRKARDLAKGVPDSDGFTYDDERPWEYVFRKMPCAYQFWHWEFERGASRLGNAIGLGVSGEAPVGRSPESHVSNPSVGAPAAPQSGPKPARKERSRSARMPPPAKSSGNHTTNRQGRKLCFAFQSESCTTQNCSFAHQCAVCLDNRHGAEQCPKKHGIFKDTIAESKSKGQGKGGKGKSGKNYHG
jgi:hypothetical protein